MSDLLCLTFLVAFAAATWGLICLCGALQPKGGSR
jgi:hypothetical protein